MTESSNDKFCKKADKLGITPQDESYLEFERRVQSAAKDKRESKIVIIALVSAIASVLSALAAWFAVLSK